MEENVALNENEDGTAAPEDELRTEISVRRYGLRDPLNWGPDIEDELRRQNQFWNRLVEIEHRSRQGYFEIMQSFGDIEAMSAEIKELKERRDALKAERKAIWGRSRKRVATTELNSHIAELSTIIKSRAITLKEERTRFNEEAKPRLQELNDGREAAVKAARQTCGCFWGNYNAVAMSYKVARVRAIKTGAELRFHRFEGGGRITNQLQEAPETSEFLAFGTSQVKLTHVPGERLALLSVTVYTGKNAEGKPTRRTVTFPMIYHRPLEPGFQVKQVAVLRRRVASKWKYHVVFTSTRKTDEVLVPPIGPDVAIDLGWRKTPEGLRVGTVLTRGEARPWHVMLPNDYLGKYERVENRQSRRDLWKDEVLKDLKALDWSTAPAVLQALWEPLKRAPKLSTGRLAQLAMEWRNHNWSRGDELVKKWQQRDIDFAMHVTRAVHLPLWKDDAFLEAWRRADKLQWERQENRRQNLKDRQKNIYRCAAKRIVEGAGRIILEDLDLSKLARLETAGGELTELHKASRHNRQMAAPYELRMAIVQAAAKRGIPVIFHSGVSTWLHCGERIYPAKPDELIQRCPHCGEYWDQDENACINMLYGAVDEGHLPDEEVLAAE
jgi:hypothetical protein